MSWKSIDKLFNLDKAYLLVVFILLLLIYDEHNILDMLYLGLMTFYYIRIKVHRFRRKKLNII